MVSKTVKINNEVSLVIYEGTSQIRVIDNTTDKAYVLKADAIVANDINDEDLTRIDVGNFSVNVNPTGTANLTYDGGGVFSYTPPDLSGYLTSETDSQTLSLAGNNLSISSGNTVDLSTLTTDLTGYATESWVTSQGYITSETDSQTLSLAGNDLSISGGNTIDLSTIIPSLVDGDLVGSVFGDDSSTLLVDGVNSVLVGNVQKEGDWTCVATGDIAFGTVGDFRVSLADTIQFVSSEGIGLGSVGDIDLLSTDNDINLIASTGRIYLKTTDDGIDISAGNLHAVVLAGGQSDLEGNPVGDGGSITVGINTGEIYFPPQITIPDSVYQLPAESNTRIDNGLEVRDDLVLVAGSKLCIRERIVFQDGSTQLTGYQGRELQHSTITSGVFYNRSITEPASGIDWGSSDEFGNHISTYGNYLLVGAPGYIAGGQTNAVGRAYLYNLTTGATIATIDMTNSFEDRIDANFGAAVAAGASAGNFVLIGAPGYDTGHNNRAIGLVEVRQITNGTYVRSIDPPVADVPASGDMRFGASIVADERIVAIAAPDYPCSGGGTGRVYVYRSSDFVLIDTIDNPFGEGTYATSLSISEDPKAVTQGGYFTASVITVGSNYAVTEIYADNTFANLITSTTRTYTNPNPADQNFAKFAASSERYVVASAYEKPDGDSTAGGAVYVWDKQGIVPPPINEQLKWIFTPPGDDPNYNFGRGLGLIEGEVLAVAGPGAETAAGMITFYDLHTGTVLNQITLDLPDDNAQLGRNSVLLTNTHLIAHAPGNNNIYIYDYQKNISSSTSTKGKALVADGFGGFGFAKSNMLHTYTDTDDRDTIITSPTGGEMIYLEDTGSSGSPTGLAGIMVYDGTAGQWRTLNWT